MKNPQNKILFYCFSNDVWFFGHQGHRSGQNGILKKVDLPKSGQK
jgi:hypothetical protein